MKQLTKSEVSVREQKRALLHQRLQKTYNDSTVIKKLSDVISIEAISTGSLLLDNVTGIGGIPRGRVTEIHGLEASGKTTIALGAVREIQKQGGLALIIDAENALSPEWATKIGVDMDNIDIVQETVLEDVFDMLETIVSEGVYDIIVLDSIGALTTRSEMEGTMDQQGMGVKARGMGKALRKINQAIAKSKTALILINHLYANIGNQWQPFATGGGNAIRYYCSMRIEITKIGSKLIPATEIVTDTEATLKNPEQQCASPVRIKIIKNKVGSPGAKIETKIVYEKPLLVLPNGAEKVDDKVQLGFNMYEELFDASFSRGLITQLSPKKYSIAKGIVGSEEDIEGTYSSVVEQVRSNNVYFENLLENYKKSFNEEYIKELMEKKGSSTTQMSEEDKQNIKTFERLTHFDVVFLNRGKYKIDTSIEHNLEEEKFTYDDIFNIIFDEGNKKLLSSMIELADEREKSGEYSPYAESSEIDDGSEDEPNDE